MKIEVTIEHIEGSKATSITNCVCARAISDATGRPVYIGGYTNGEGNFDDAPYETFKLDQAGCDFIKRMIGCSVRYGKEGIIERNRWFGLLKPKIVQPTGSFEISWNPPAKNWSYKTVQPQVLEEELA